MPVRRPVLSALAGVGTTVLACGLVAAPAQAAPVTIRLLTVNDFHGRLSADEAGGPGAVALAGAVEALSTGQPTAFVSAGDNIGATPFVSAVQDDAPTLEVLGAIGLAASAVGNHEFDRGYAFLAADATHGLGGDGLATWPTLGANVVGETPEMAASEVITVGGVRVGLVGVVTEQTASLVSPDGIAGISFVDPVGPANAAAELLTDGDDSNGEADVLVLLAHEGAPTALGDPATCAELTTGGNAFADLVSGLSDEYDAVVGGHTHLVVDCEVPREGALALPVVEATAYGNALGQLDFTVETDTGQLTASSGAVVPVVPVADGGPAPSTTTVADIVAAAEAEADVVGEEVVGEITDDITRALIEVDGELEDDRGNESVLGNFIADVQLAATADPELGGAEIAFMNPGGLRDDFLVEPSGDEAPGEVTYAEAATVQPFANGVITMTLTGEQVRQVLEQQWQPEGSSRPYLALGVSEGFFYTYDPDAPQGERIVSVTLDGVELDPAEPYRVTVNSFLAAGGDNFTVLTEGTDRQDNGFNDLNILVDYLRANSPVTADTEPRRAVVDDEPAPSPSPTPSVTPTATPTTTAPSRTNPGLKVDTGRTDPVGPAPATLLAVLLLLAAAGGTTVALRRARGRH